MSSASSTPFLQTLHFRGEKPRTVATHPIFPLVAIARKHHYDISVYNTHTQVEVHRFQLSYLDDVSRASRQARRSYATFRSGSGSNATCFDSSDFGHAGSALNRGSQACGMRSLTPQPSQFTSRSSTGISSERGTSVSSSFQLATTNGATNNLASLTAQPGSNILDILSAPEPPVDTLRGTGNILSLHFLDRNVLYWKMHGEHPPRNLDDGTECKRDEHRMSQHSFDDTEVGGSADALGSRLVVCCENRIIVLALDGSSPRCEELTAQHLNYTPTGAKGVFTSLEIVGGPHCTLAVGCTNGNIRFWHLLKHNISSLCIISRYKHITHMVWGAPMIHRENRASVRSSGFLSDSHGTPEPADDRNNRDWMNESSNRSVGDGMKKIDAIFSDSAWNSINGARLYVATAEGSLTCFTLWEFWGSSPKGATAWQLPKAHTDTLLSLEYVTSHGILLTYTSSGALAIHRAENGAELQRVVPSRRLPKPIECVVVPWCGGPLNPHLIHVVLICERSPLYHMFLECPSSIANEHAPKGAEVVKYATSTSESQSNALQLRIPVKWLEVGRAVMKKDIHLYGGTRSSRQPTTLFLTSNHGLIELNLWGMTSMWAAPRSCVSTSSGSVEDPAGFYGALILQEVNHPTDPNIAETGSTSSSRTTTPPFASNFSGKLQFSTAVGKRSQANRDITAQQPTKSEVCKVGMVIKDGLPIVEHEYKVRFDASLAEKPVAPTEQPLPQLKGSVIVGSHSPSTWSVRASASGAYYLVLPRCHTNQSEVRLRRSHNHRDVLLPDRFQQEVVQDAVWHYSRNTFALLSVSNASGVAAHILNVTQKKRNKIAVFEAVREEQEGEEDDVDHVEVVACAISTVMTPTRLFGGRWLCVQYHDGDVMHFYQWNGMSSVGGLLPKSDLVLWNPSGRCCALIYDRTTIECMYLELPGTQNAWMPVPSSSSSANRSFRSVHSFTLATSNREIETAHWVSDSCLMFITQTTIQALCYEVLQDTVRSPVSRSHTFPTQVTAKLFCIATTNVSNVQWRLSGVDEKSSTLATSSEPMDHSENWSATVTRPFLTQPVLCGAQILALYPSRILLILRSRDFYSIPITQHLFQALVPSTSSFRNMKCDSGNANKIVPRGTSSSHANDLLQCIARAKSVGELRVNMFEHRSQFLQDRQHLPSVKFIWHQVMHEVRESYLRDMATLPQRKHDLVQVLDILRELSSMP